MRGWSSDGCFPRSSLCDSRLEWTERGTRLGLGRWGDTEVSTFRRWPWSDLVTGECGNPWQFQLASLSFIPHLTYFTSSGPGDQYALQSGAVLWTQKIATQRHPFPIEWALCPLSSGHECLASCIYLQALVCPPLYQCLRLTGEWGFLWFPLILVFHLASYLCKV